MFYFIPHSRLGSSNSIIMYIFKGGGGKKKKKHGRGIFPKKE